LNIFVLNFVRDSSDSFDIDGSSFIGQSFESFEQLFKDLIGLIRRDFLISIHVPNDVNDHFSDVFVQDWIIGFSDNVQNGSDNSDKIRIQFPIFLLAFGDFLQKFADFFALDHAIVFFEELQQLQNALTG
jgi:hypothetical protein